VPYRVEDIAAYHLETMREVQKEGPYVIAGWCAAGVIAYEMAVQLRAAGEHVALLALFDAANPAAAQAPFDLIKRTKSISRAAVARGPADGPPLLAYVSRQLVRRAVGWADQIGIRPRFGDAGLIHDLALRHYRPAPYAGRTILFRRGTDLVGRYRENELGWDGLIRDLEVHVIPGDHRQIFAEPQVQLVATRLAAAIGAIDASPFFEPTHREDR
jgi:thioesterase domain-containing protein